MCARPRRSTGPVGAFRAGVAELITIPGSILREAGLAAGDEVVIRASGHGGIEIERADDLVPRFAGSLPAGTYPDGYLDELRDWRE